jgi:hypothetical protein
MTRFQITLGEILQLQHECEQGITYDTDNAIQTERDKQNTGAREEGRGSGPINDGTQIPY